MSTINYDLKKIKALVFDVDGVLSANVIPMSSDGEPMRTVNIKDGYALHLACKQGLLLGIITGGRSEAVRKRFMALGIPSEDIYMASSVKIHDYHDFRDRYGLRDEEITIRMSGCPNGCSRPALGEIAFIGKAPGKYNMYLGGGFAGQRLNKLYRENIGEKEILAELDPLIKDYAKNRYEAEHLGDFVIRSGYVKETTDGTNFHDL